MPVFWVTYLLSCPVQTATPTEMGFNLCIPLPHHLPLRVVVDCRSQPGAWLASRRELERDGPRRVQDTQRHFVDSLLWPL